MKTLQELEKEFRECNKCKVYKRFSEFYADPKGHNGLAYSCKCCTKSRVNKNYARIKEDPELYKARLDQTREYKEIIKSDPNYTREFVKYQRFADEKSRARTKLKYYIDHGYITRMPCQICGDPKSQGHHEDYSKPFNVIWLCQNHHQEIHRKFNTIRERL